MTSHFDASKKSWSDIEITFHPSDVLSTCKRAEKEIFSLEAKGTQSDIQRNARANGALIEFTNLQARDRARVLGVNENSIWYLGRKWVELDSQVRQGWLKIVHTKLQK